jgi:TolB-like protein/Tfp pilus assembly protein PilF
MGVAATIAVLPFDNPSGDPAQDYLARGFVDDLLTELARFPTVDVIHPGAPGAPDTAAPAAAYLLRGSVRRLGEVVRIAAQLVQADGGRLIWADRFDAAGDGLLAAQDEIVARVASALPAEIDADRLQGARRKPLHSLDVYDCWLRGVDFLRLGTVEDDQRARAFFERALALDPHWARGHAGLSLSHFNEWSCQAWELWDDNERLAFEHASRAAALDDRDGLVQIVLARILLYRRRFAEAERHVARALELAPGDAEVLTHAALCQVYLGDADGAAALAARARRLHPRHPAWYLVVAGVAAFVRGDDAEAAALLATAPRAMVDVPAYLAAAHARLGDRDRAAASVADFLADFVEKITFGRAAEPGEPLRWVLHVNPFRRPDDAAALAGGLARAGLAADPDEQRRPVAANHALAAPATAAVFRREQGRWTLGWAGNVVHVDGGKGLHDLAQLLAAPGTPIHCLELAGRGDEPTGADPVLDPRARRELAERARALQETIDAAEVANDLGRAGAARDELERIIAVVERALGLGGRPRRLGSPAERARSAVTWRIRSTIRKVQAAHPALGRHLDNAIRTGTYCSYLPETPVDWVL